MLGGIISPQNAFLLGRGLKTLALRVRHQNNNAQQVAEYLEGHPGIEQVWYPGLHSHPDHEIASRQMEGFGGVVSFTIHGTLEETAAFIDRHAPPIHHAFAWRHGKPDQPTCPYVILHPDKCRTPSNWHFRQPRALCPWH